MPEHRMGSSRLPSSYATVTLVVALAAIVATASHGTPVWTLLRDGYADRAEVLAGVAALCAVGLILAMAITVTAHRALYARRANAPPLKTTLARAVPLTIALLAAISLLTIARADLEGSREAGMEPGHFAPESGRSARPLNIDWWSSFVRAGEDTRGEGQLTEMDRDAGSGVPVELFMAAAILATIAAAFAWRGHRRRPPPHGSDDDAAESHRDAMHGAVVNTIDAMLADPDPNTAIRGAYARLLEALAASGTGRRQHEAPVEHLHRVLAVLDVRPAPLRDLIDLFAVARFSTHPLGPSHRERALAALRAVADDLRATARR